jgi:hypothetical protein
MLEKMMRRIPLLISLLTPLLLLPVGHGQSLTPASGNLVTTVTSETVSQVDNIVTIHEHFTLAISGTLSGTTDGTATVIVNLGTGNGVFFGTQTLTGTVLQHSGTVQLEFSATFVGNSFQGQSTLYGGTGGLTNLNGHVTIQGIINVSGSYSGFVTLTS